ncbi:ABC transporter substrate-binding protein [Georgenia sp. Z1491]|uniref:ABC transporter substrate-binding protein n=1 Tax=Georgenia sp. Z1491 TaxID=3416707 RepID=UPI003CFA71BA
MRRQTPIAAAAAAGLALTLGACGGADDDGDGGDAEGLETVDVIHVPSTLFAPLYVADERGYFEEAGIELSLDTVQAGQDAIPLTAAGQADVLIAGFGSGLFSAVNDELEIRVVGSMGGGGGEPDNSPTALMVATDLVESGEISEISDLEGRTVALSGGLGGAGAYQFAAVLLEADLTLNDIEVLNVGFGDMAGALTNGQADAAMPPAPFTTAMEEDGTAEQFALPPAGTIASGVIYNEEFIDSDLAQPFFDALVRGSLDLQDDPYDPEILQILADATGQDLEVLEANPSYVWEPDLAPATEQLQLQQEAFRAAGLFDFDNDVPLEDLVDTRFAENAPTE